MGPQLLANSPVHFGDSPQGVRSRGRLVITNGGDTPLEINDFKLEPDDGVFQVGVSELPLSIAGRRSSEITIQFWPRSIGAFRAELSFDSNHDGNTLSPIVLIGNGITDQVCLPCTPAPEPECNFDLASSLVYVPNTSTDCESESGECGYRIIEIPCENEECDPDTGLCPNGVIPTFDAGPEPSICGDGNQENDEECDDGNTDNGDGCSDTCTIESGWDCSDEECEPICGDGQQLSDEECDDGNTDNGDGCSDTCTIESGWDCTDEECEPICGDNVLAGDEECDDGNTTQEGCAYAETSCTVCGPTCTYVPGLIQNCGDGILQDIEECDNGADNNSNTASDACREDCTNATCGDDVLDTGEACDDGNTTIEACAYGEEACTVCGSLCSFVPGITSLCGDGVVQGFEECDDGAMNSLDQPDACRENCMNAACGDETQDSDEACDDGNINNGDGCSSTCATETGWDCTEEPCEPICGDNIQVGSEECDDGGESVGCDNDCTLAVCGDGNINTTAGENCDDNNTLPDDGCDINCLIEDGWSCDNTPSVCTETGDAGETCEDAIALTGAGGSITNTFGESNELNPGDFGSPSCTDPYPTTDGYEIVYKITLNQGEQFEITNAIADNSLVDISIYLVDSCDFNAGTCVAGADDWFDGDAESLTYPLSGGAFSTTTYFLIVDAWCAGESNYCPTSSDTFSFDWAILSPT